MGNRALVPPSDSSSEDDKPSRLRPSKQLEQHTSPLHSSLRDEVVEKVVLQDLGEVIAGHTAEGGLAAGIEIEGKAPSSSSSHGATSSGAPHAVCDKFEVTLERGPGEAWGFAWHVGACAERRLIVAGIDPTSPAGRWGPSQRTHWAGGIQRGDELLTVNGMVEHRAMRRELVSAVAAILLFRRSGRSDVDPTGWPSHSVSGHRTAPLRPLDRYRAGAAAETTSGLSASVQQRAKSALHQKATADAWRVATQPALTPGGQSVQDRIGTPPLWVYVKNTFLHVQCDQPSASKGGEECRRELCPGAGETSRLSLSDPLSNGIANGSVLSYDQHRAFAEDFSPHLRSHQASRAWRSPLLEEGSAAAHKEVDDSPRSSLSFWSATASHRSSSSRRPSVDAAGEKPTPNGEGLRKSRSRSGSPSTDVDRRRWTASKPPPSPEGGTCGGTSDAPSNPRSFGSGSRCPSTDWDYLVSPYFSYAPPVLPGVLQGPIVMPVQSVTPGFDDKGLDSDEDVAPPCEELLSQPLPDKQLESGSKADANAESGDQDEDAQPRRFKPTRRAGRRVQRRRTKRQAQAEAEERARAEEEAKREETSGPSLSMAQEQEELQPPKQGCSEGSSPVQADDDKDLPTAMVESRVEGLESSQPMHPAPSGSTVASEALVRDDEKAQQDLLGKQVLIVGLERAPQFNGRWGRVEAFDVAANRCTVRIFSGEEPSVLALLRRDNLSIPPSVPAAECCIEDAYQPDHRVCTTAAQGSSASLPQAPLQEARSIAADELSDPPPETNPRHLLASTTNRQEKQETTRNTESWQKEHGKGASASESVSNIEGAKPPKVGSRAKSGRRPGASSRAPAKSRKPCGEGVDIDGGRGDAQTASSAPKPASVAAAERPRRQWRSRKLCLEAESELPSLASGSCGQNMSQPMDKSDLA